MYCVYNERKTQSTGKKSNPLKKLKISTRGMIFFFMIMLLLPPFVYGSEFQSEEDKIKELEEFIDKENGESKYWFLFDEELVPLSISKSINDFIFSRYPKFKVQIGNNTDTQKINAYNKLKPIDMFYFKRKYREYNEKNHENDCIISKFDMINININSILTKMEFQTPDDTERCSLIIKTHLENEIFEYQRRKLVIIDPSHNHPNFFSTVVKKYLHTPLTQKEIENNEIIYELLDDRFKEPRANQESNEDSGYQQFREIYKEIFDDIKFDDMNAESVELESINENNENSDKQEDREIVKEETDQHFFNISNSSENTGIREEQEQRSKKKYGRNGNQKKSFSKTPEKDKNSKKKYEKENIEKLSSNDGEETETKDVRLIDWCGVSLIIIFIGFQTLLVFYLHFSKNIFCVLMSHYKFEEEIEEDPDFYIEIVSGDEMNEVSVENGVDEAELANEHISDFNVVSVDECTASDEYTTENEDSDDITDSEEIKQSENTNMEEEQEDEENSEDTDGEEEEQEDEETSEDTDGEEEEQDEEGGEKEEETFEDEDAEEVEEKFRHRHLGQW